MMLIPGLQSRILKNSAIVVSLIGLAILLIGYRNDVPMDAVSASAQSQQIPAPSRIPTYGYEVINTYPHDRQAFTQGLVYHEGFLFESTGLTGQSSLRKVELATGRVLKKLDVPSPHFAEGLALFGGQAVQLTWLSQLGFVYDQETFQLNGNFSYTGEGWGLTDDGQSLIMSDGTEQIRFLDPQTYQVRRTIRVLDRGAPLRRLNELEYIDGEIWANIWTTDRIVRLSPDSGRIIAFVDLTGLLPAADRVPSVDVLNGIAWDRTGKRLFVTGKLWPKLFEIRLRSRRDPIIRPN